MSFQNDDPHAREARQGGPSPEGVPSEGSPQGVMEGRPGTSGVEIPKRMGFYEAEQSAREQIGLSTLYIRPKEPTDAQSYALWRGYHEKMELAAALCMTIAEVYTMGDNRLIRVDGEEIEAATVKTIFLRLNGDHVCKVINAIRMEKDAEKKTAKLNRRYFRAALYNAVFEIEAQGQAGADRPADGWPI